MSQKNKKRLIILGTCVHKPKRFFPKRVFIFVFLHIVYAKILKKTALLLEIY